MSRLRRVTSLLPDSPGGRLFVGLTFVDSLGTGLYLAGAVVYFVHGIGLTNGQIGTALSLAGIVGFVTAVPMGIAADRFGAKRLLVLVQFWRAGWFTALALCTGPYSFGLVACGLAVAESATPALSQAVIADAVGDAQRNRTMALVRSVRNIGFSVGALLAAPLVSTDRSWTALVVVLGNALSFAVVGALLTRLRTPRTTRAHSTGLLAQIKGFRSPRYLVLAALTSVLSLHMTLLPVVIPLWIIQGTDASAWTISALLVVNTGMAVFLQIPLSKRAEDVPGSTVLLRWSGPALAACCAAMIAASLASGWAAVGLLAVGMVCMTLAEIWQSAAGWTLSYAFAPARHRVQYLAVFSLSGLVAQEIAGPGVLGGLMIDAGRIGWAVLAAVFLLSVPLVGPVVGALARQGPDPGEPPGTEEPAGAQGNRDRIPSHTQESP
ncbi:MFS transporter [Streptomyces sp. NPDC054766]|uniref:MFS transporter n=1 Tax=Streptomyces rhizosphaerihabitans TaxID=1266770 RepID=UPI0021BFE6D0|nr:MFS transporter [Streptomyces rhizosphaerihabitans]MCT9008508.1 MFS transporter [Streptomyces rhizosphaerihabitans]